MNINENRNGKEESGGADIERRRRFLKAAGRATGSAALGASAVLGMLGSTTSHAKTSGSSGQVPLLEARQASELKGAVAKLEPMMSRRLHLVNEHTGDDFNVVFYSYGHYINENVSRLNLLMRDRRANEATQMDTTLYNQLFLLRSMLGTDEPIHILSGYRTQKTNDKLRRRSKRVAKYSLHMEGRAADIYIPGYPAAKIQEAALSLQAGGVGLYSKSNFVHMDTGQIRHWGS